MNVLSTLNVTDAVDLMGATVNDEFHGLAENPDGYLEKKEGLRSRMTILFALS